MTLCKGFSTTRIDGSDILETLYALLNDGTVLVSCEHKRTNEFSKNGRRWFVSEYNQDWLKNNTEFIGNYPVPSTRF